MRLPSPAAPFFRWFAAVVLASLIGAGCQAKRDWLPRTHTVSVSPDGRHAAFVRQGLNIDPPDDYLFLGEGRGRARCLMHLAPDSDWCRTIVWTQDSRLVAYLVRDQQLAIFDTATFEHVAMLPLVRADGYPGSEGARHVVLDDGGRAVSFERFERASGRALASERVGVPGPRLSLHITWAGASTSVPDAWVSVRLADGREVSIRTTPGADGLVRLPAIDAGPVPLVHVKAAGSTTWTILREVEVGGDPVRVELRR